MDNSILSIPLGSNITLPIIGIHRSPLSQKFGTPRQPNLVNLSSQIHLFAPYDTQDAFVGIEQFSHLWIVWQFHHNKAQASFRPQVRPPRLGGNDKMGVFATRSMYRPSGLGLSVVALDKISCADNGRGVVLHLLGADMIDGTPIIDIKPYLPYSDSLPTATSPMTTPSTKDVQWSEIAKHQADDFVKSGKLTQQDLDIIHKLIAQDPRPAYRQQETNTPFSMRYDGVDVVFFMQNMSLMIDELKAVV